MKTIRIIQARMGSNRLPNKVMRKITGTPMIGVLLGRISKAKGIDKIIVATTDSIESLPLVKYVRELGYSVYQGNESDVLDRYYQTALMHNADSVIRITGDCPLIDPVIVDEVIEKFKCSQVDYASNINPPTYPDGLDVEIFTFSALERAYNETTETYHREHVTPYIRESGLFKQVNISSSIDLSDKRWTVDEPEDFEIVKNIFEHFQPEISFGWKDILSLNENNPNLFKSNHHLARNEGMKMRTGQKLYKRAKKVIPGGTMLLSKRPEMFLPDQWPAYFSKSKGCRVWDLDDREYIDMSIMGIGTNILGFGHPEVDEAVIETVKNGNMSTFLCPEEVYLAERLIEMHPWADMVRFARAGGEINSIAIRIARAATGNDKIAICGYHGWHDWYLSTNLNDDKNLDGHLLPGLEPNGVPRGLTGTTLPFNYNDIEQLETIVSLHSGEIAAIKMEVSRNEGPENNFLQKVRDLATKNNIVLIFDECTSGFRETFGGLHKKYGVEPDMAIFAKALGNGYAISACIGKKEFMGAAQNTFISSTFWTERIGPTAALKTLEVMEREKSWEQITNIGNSIRERWKLLAKKYELPLEINGLPALTGFSFSLEDMLKYKTLIAQEMLKKGFLAATSVYICTEHKQPIVDDYFEALDPVFALIKECEEGKLIDELLEGPICHSGFKRLN